MFTENTKEAAFGRLHKGKAAFGRHPFVVSFVLAVNTGHILVLSHGESQDICIVEAHDMCCAES